MKHLPTCEVCPFHKLNRRMVSGKGNKKAELLLIGEAPGKTETRYGVPFVGEAGKLLNHVLRKLSINRDKIYITNVFKCQPPDNKLPSKKQQEACWMACRGYLMSELVKVGPKVVVLMGNTPLSFLAHKNFISKWEGLEVGWGREITMKNKVFACYHPAAALRAPRLEARIATALYVAAKKAGLKPKPIGMEAGMYDYQLRS